MKLRDYQSAALADVARAFAGGARRVLLVLPTGGGKTVCFAHVAKQHAEAARSVLIAAHRRELVRQASDKLAALDVPHGVIAPGWPLDLSAPVQVGSVQTLTRRLDQLPRFDLIVPDEAHHAITGQWSALLQSQPDACVLGVTATPERRDGRGLGDVFQRMVIGPTVPQLIAADHLVGSQVFAPAAAPDLRRVESTKGDFDPAGAAAVMDVPGVVGDAVEHYGWHCPAQPAIAFCVSVAHAQHTAEAFRARGWRAVAIDGGTPAPERDAALAGLATGAVEVVCSCDLISEGLDVPAVAAVIFLRPTESLGLYLQMGGRGMRPADGKRVLTVLDHAGNTFRHGLLDSARDWTLDGVTKRNRTVPAVRQCDSCFAIFSPRPACPECGAASAGEQRGARRLRTGDGQLIELSAEDARLANAPLSGLVKEARSYGQLEAIRVARGYAPGWTDAVMTAKARIRGRYVR